MSRKRRHQAGYAMIVVFLLVGVMAGAGAAVLGLVDTGLNVAGRNRERAQASAIAEGAVMEVIDDDNIATVLPDYTSAGLKATYRPLGVSPWIDTSQKMTYDAEVRFLRVAPLAESSQSWSRAMVYEIDAIGSVADGDVTEEVSAEVFRTITIPAGTLLPRMHAK
jgi:hypothetical protein